AVGVGHLRGDGAGRLAAAARVGPLPSAAGAADGDPADPDRDLPDGRGRGGAPRRGAGDALHRAVPAGDPDAPGRAVLDGRGGGRHGGVVQDAGGDHRRGGDGEPGVESGVGGGVDDAAPGVAGFGAGGAVRAGAVYGVSGDGAVPVPGFDGGNVAFSPPSVTGGR